MNSSVFVYGLSLSKLVNMTPAVRNKLIKTMKILLKWNTVVYNKAVSLLSLKS